MKHIKGTRASGRGNLPVSYITAASLSLVDVQAACDACADGGAVVLPAGDVTWARTADATVIGHVGAENSLSIWNKSIRLIGAGYTGSGSKTIIRHDGVGTESTTGHRLVHIYVGTSTQFGEITGIDFICPTGYVFSSGTGFFYISEVGTHNFRIHHNTFDDFANYSGVIYTSAGADKCLFDHNIILGVGGGVIVDGVDNSDYITAPTYGTSNFAYIEDNNFNFTNTTATTTKRPCNDVFRGGRIAFRHNTIANGFMQVHDKSRQGTGGGSFWEVSNNTFTCNDASVPLWKAIDIGSGTGVCWNNSINGHCYYPVGVLDTRSDTNSSPSIGGQTHCTGAGGAVDQNVGLHGYICEMQVGSAYTPSTSVTGSNLTSSPAYFWNNSFTGTTYGSAAFWPGGVAGPLVNIYYTDSSGYTNEHIQKGRDFIENGSAKPGYTEYTYPHPLQASGTTWT